MKIFKTYKVKLDWVETSSDELIKNTEGRGYYKDNTALKVLQETGEIQTPTAIWRCTID